MKKVKWSHKIIVVAIVMLALAGSAVYANENMGRLEGKDYTDHMIFVVDSKETRHNGELFLSNYPTTIREGVTYIPLRVLAERLGLSVHYDSQRKEARISSGEIALQFRPNQAQYKVNNQTRTSTHGVAFVENGTLMIPLRTFTSHFNMKVNPQLDENAIHLYWSTKPIAKFSIEPTAIYAEDTKVTYVDQYKHPQNLGIINEVWEGKQEVFETPGTYTIKRRVQDENGTWSDPFEVKLEVLPPKQPPVAKFSTDKDKYLMGEPITYIDESKDPEDNIVETTWTNKEAAFFVAGEQEVTLEVVNQHGLKSTYTKTIVIEEEVLYTKKEFNEWFVPTGQKYLLSEQNVLSFPTIKYEIEQEEHILYRNNSPESIKQEGVYYRDIVQGNVRPMIHKQNHRENPVHIYLIARNINDEAVEIKTPNIGVGGPHQWVTTTAKTALVRYFNTFDNPNTTSIVLEPGESSIIFPEINQRRIAKGQTLSIYAELSTSLPIEMQTVIIDTGKDIFEELPLLTDVPRDGIHIRGSFPYGNRSIEIEEVVGEDTKRIVFGDPQVDTRVVGIDHMSGELVTNRGNYGVLYKLNLERVAPQSVILLNARGGHYSGAFVVNGEVVMVTDGSHLLNSNEIAVLYRSGDQEEAVDIKFIPASGSNLPLNIIIQPLPEKRH